MSVQTIIQESVNKNPLKMKQAVEEELRLRIAEAVFSKTSEVEGINQAIDRLGEE